ncbi:alpha/beta fold hydrolase [Streptomyces sp. TS71-3]|uniref:alpha/beta fold hydrolase n=1 Tax=Streptomyces sp. TS71-3 TaxID=2733862 RepID=UPI001AFE0077|nr:alpha/beta hydrolase [Streptomyces sp. TS71-3]GHJ37170.1 hydrolase [Streptomyces sp. TS71-3]
MSELAYDSVGSGPALVLVPGTNSTARDTWGPTVEALAASHTVIMPDLPGTGSSPLTDGPLDPESVAWQLADVAVRAGHDRFAIAGASLGAPLALLTAARFPDRVTHVTTVCGYASARPSLRLRLDLWERILDAGPEAVGRLLLILGMPDATAAELPPETLNRMIIALGARRERGVRRQIELARTIDVEADLGTIRVPALVIGGGQDQFVAPAHSRVVADRLRTARLLMLDGSHGLAHEQPDAISAAVGELARV